MRLVDGMGAGVAFPGLGRVGTLGWGRRQVGVEIWVGKDWAACCGVNLAHFIAGAVLFEFPGMERGGHFGLGEEAGWG